MPNEFHEIFYCVCHGKGIPYGDDGLRYLLQKHYLKINRELRGCHPRDICEQVLDEATYRSIAPTLNKELIDRACAAYFVKF